MIYQKNTEESIYGELNFKAFLLLCCLKEFYYQFHSTLRLSDVSQSETMGDYYL